MNGPGRGVARAARIALIVAAAGVLGGWDGATVREVAWRAVPFFPGDLARQVRRHHRRYDAGIEAGLRLPPAWRAGPPGRLREALRRQALLCRDGLRRPIPFAELTERLGTLAVLVADANDPLAVEDSDPREPRYAGAWVRYGRSTLPRIRFVFYGREPRLIEDGDLDGFLDGILARSRRLYPFVGAEFYRTGTLRPWTELDDRSVAFGVAGVALSHAMTDLANLAAWIWVEGGGAAPTPLPTPPGHEGPTVTVLLGGGLPERDRPAGGRPAIPGGRLRVPR